MSKSYNKCEDCNIHDVKYTCHNCRKHICINCYFTIRHKDIFYIVCEKCCIIYRMSPSTRKHLSKHYDTNFEYDPRSLRKYSI